MIATLLITVLVEAMVVTGYSLRRHKPVGPILITSLFANLVTQSMLWFVLDVFFRHYLLGLISAEILIWGIESLFLYLIPANRLKVQEAFVLSLWMNLMSLALGWFLPV